MKTLEETSALECVQNAQINFENLERFFPQLKTHPVYMIAKEQLDNGVNKLEQDNE